MRGAPVGGAAALRSGPLPDGALFLGLDVGTQGTKALLVDAAAGTVLARASAPHAFVPGLGPGHLEQQPEDWLTAAALCLRTVLDGVDPARLHGLAVSGQQHGAVVLDGSGRVVRPAKLWCDTATAAEARELAQTLGRAVPTGFTASKLLWLCRHEPAAFARVRHVLLPHDYVNFALTGQYSMEYGDASGTGWFDPVSRQWDPQAVAAIAPNLAALLPPFVLPGGLAGTVTAAAAARFGLPEGLPVATGGGDNMMSALGSGATVPGVVVVSLGTSGTIFTRSDTPVVDPAGLIAPFCSSDGAWLPLLCVMNLTGVTEEVQRLTGLGHTALTDAARAVPVGCEGLLWLPFLVGERVPDLPTATGTLLGLRPGLLRPGHLYRAALEGTSCNLAAGLERLRALGVQPGEVRLAGGAAANALWRQVLADLFAVPVAPLVEAESAALGAAIQAAWAVRRARGERELTAAAVAAPCVRVGAAVAPRPEFAAAHQALRQAFAAAVLRLHPS